MWIAIGPWGNPGGPRETLEDPGGPRCSPFAMPADKIKPPGTQDGCRGCHGCRGSGIKTCCSEPYSTRAWGQDDGSYTSSLKRECDPEGLDSPGRVPAVSLSIDPGGMDESMI